MIDLSQAILSAEREVNSKALSDKWAEEYSAWDGKCPTCGVTVKDSERKQLPEHVRQYCYRCTWLRFASVPVGIIRDIDRFDPTFNNQQAHLDIALRTVAKGKCLMIGGTNGVGKTTISVMAMYSRIKARQRFFSQGSNCRFVSMLDFGNEYATAGYEKRDLLDNLTACKRLFVFDDIGREKGNDLFQVLINHCDTHRIQFIGTTNLTGQEIEDRYGEATMSRIRYGAGEGTGWVKLTGRDYRKQERK